MFDEFTGFKDLTVEQKDAIIKSLDCNSLVLAGAGSGKTRVLITRIEYLLKVLKVEPSAIMAITFTNRAAKELITRAEQVTSNADEMTVGTYHAICNKLLMDFGEDIGLGKFTILDKGEQIRVVKEVLTNMGAIVSKKVVLSYCSKMSKLKNKFINPRMYREMKMKKYNGCSEKFRDDPEYQFIDFYSKYQMTNKNNDRIDFDDIIMYAMALLQSSKNVQEYIRDTFKYIHADEVQDSNEGNIRLLNEFSKHANLFMVGDMDQSIYGFRNARPDYFVKLQERGEIEIFKLQQNFRSTKTIVNASNAIIENNKDRIPKTCYSEKESLDKIQYYNAPTAKREASFVANEINMLRTVDYKYSDFMVIYRTNAQSRAFEEEFIKNDIPYVLIGSTSFNNRKEVKDCLAYLRVYANRKDKNSFIRALSTLKGVGETTIKEIYKVFTEYEDALKTLENYKAKTQQARESLNFLREVLTIVDNKPTAVLERVAELLIQRWENSTDEKAEERIENIKELLNLAQEKEDSGMMVNEFINQMDLLSKSDIESVDAVQLITVHSSKGLEANVCFVVGANEEIFPHINSLDSEEGVSEERRCFYVGCTRAKECLYITSYETNGDVNYKPSRFIGEIPNEYIINVSS